MAVESRPITCTPQVLITAMITLLYFITPSGHSLPWANEIRYLGVYIIAGREFKCSTSYAKRFFHSSIKAIFGKVGRIASEEVLLELVKSKPIPILLYGLECFLLPKSDVHAILELCLLVSR